MSWVVGWVANGARSSDHSQLSPSPSLTPPPPSDPPRSDALPSSPRGVDDDNEELDPAEEDLSEDDATPSGHGAPLQAGHAAESDAAVEAETGRDEEDEEDGDGDGDVTMRADMDVDADEEAAEEIIPEEPEAAVDPEADAQDEDDDEHEETDANGMLLSVQQLMRRLECSCPHAPRTLVACPAALGCCHARLPRTGGQVRRPPRPTVCGAARGGRPGGGDDSQR